MKKIIAFILFALFLSSNLFSQKIEWETKPIKNFLNYYVNPSGSVLAYIQEADDDYKLTFLNTQDTSVLCNKTLQFPIEKMHNYFRFVDDSTFYILSEKSHDFIDAKTGKVTLQLPSKFNSWKEVEFLGVIYPNSNCRPYYDSNFVIYNCDKGIEIIDLVNKKIAFSTYGDFSGVTIWYENGMYIINSKDDIVFFNIKERKVDYIWGINGTEFNSRFIKYFHVFDSKAVYYLDNSIGLFNFKIGQREFIRKDPDDFEYCTPLVVDSTLYFLISDEGAQTVYDVALLKKVVETSSNSLPGIIENVIETKDKKSLILFIYDNNEYVSYIAKVEKFTNKILWKTNLFKYNSEYIAKNTNMSVGSQIILGATIGALAYAVAPKYPVGMKITVIDYSDFPLKTFFNYDLNYKGEQSCSGYAEPIDIDEYALTVLCQGEITPYKPQLFEVEEEYISKIDVESGKILYYNKVVLNPDPSASNAISNHVIKSNDGAYAIACNNNLVIFKDNKVYGYKFEAENYDNFLFVNSKLFIQYKEENGDNSTLYRFDLSKPGFDKTLVAQVFEEAYIDAKKFENFDKTIYINSENVCLLHKRSDFIKEDEKLSPIWFKFRDELKYSKAVPNSNSKENFTQGITMRDDKMIIAGSKTLSSFKLDGTCINNTSWRVDADDFYIPLVFVNDMIVTLNKQDGMVIDQGCGSNKLFEYKNMMGEKGFWLNKNKTSLIMMDEEHCISFMRLTK